MTYLHTSLSVFVEKGANILKGKGSLKSLFFCASRDGLSADPTELIIIATVGKTMRIGYRSFMLNQLNFKL